VFDYLAFGVLLFILEGVFRLIFILLKKSLDFFTYLWKKVDMERLVGKYIFDPEISAGKMVFLTGPYPVVAFNFAFVTMIPLPMERQSIPQYRKCIISRPVPPSSKFAFNS
jgi:hypothetical protein